MAAARVPVSWELLAEALGFPVSTRITHAAWDDVAKTVVLTVEHQAIRPRADLPTLVPCLRKDYGRWEPAVVFVSWGQEEEAT